MTSQLDTYLPTQYSVPCLGINNEKGGVGKTSIAEFLIHAAIIRLHARVLGIDSDIQTNFTQRLLGIDRVTIKGTEYKVPPKHPDYDPSEEREVDRPSLAGVFMGETILPYRTWLSDVIDEDESLDGTADLIPSHGYKLEMVQTEYSNASGRVTTRIYNALHYIFQDESLADDYDLILIDTGPGRSPLSRAVLRTCTDVLVPFELEDASIEGVIAVKSAIGYENNARAGIGAPPLRLLGLLPNKFVRGRANTPSTNETKYEQIREVWSRDLFPDNCILPQAEVVKRIREEAHRDNVQTPFELTKKTKSEWKYRLALEHATYEILHRLLGDKPHFKAKFNDWANLIQSMEQ